MIIVYIYLAVGFLIGAIWIGTEAEMLGRSVVGDWPSVGAKFRYIVGMLVVSSLFWLPFTIIYLQAKRQDRKARRTDRL